MRKGHKGFSLNNRCPFAPSWTVTSLENIDYSP